MGPKKPRGPWLRRRDEDGAETVEFAIVVVLLITLVYGIVSVGLSLAAKVTITQAAADGARAGIVMPTAALQVSTAEAAAANDVAWMGRGTCSPTGTTITCYAAPPGPCPANPSQTCLTVTVTYNYAQSPIFPPLPGSGNLVAQHHHDEFHPSGVHPNVLNEDHEALPSRDPSQLRRPHGRAAGR